MSSEMYRETRRIKNSKKVQMHRWIILAISFVLLLFTITLLSGNFFRGDDLKGTWTLDETTKYQFEGNGEGAMILPGNTYSFKYEINEEEKTISIDFQDERAEDFVYSYVLDEDYLTLYGNIGKETFEYVLKKVYKD